MGRKPPNMDTAKFQVNPSNESPHGVKNLNIVTRINLVPALLPLPVMSEDQRMKVTNVRRLLAGMGKAFAL